ncbi:hypothetical protein HHI36_016571 [Cryptolaemus montrouzieri]|uniref:Lipase n=1 Tax=Cryptolaemus montrouzieri TaxID=559131 RepID=A0ABD2NKZ6_9CUCU
MVKKHELYLKFLLSEILLLGQVTLDPHPDAHLLINQLADKYGYPMEIHEVITEDGYILTMQRIPHGRNGTSANLRVALLVHGLLTQAEQFVLQGMYHGSLAYSMADNGYDVWLANCRGTSHSRKHISYSSKQPQFWNFSFHEIGIYDLPAKIDYILEKTKKRKIYYVGYSQGGTVFYVMCTERPEYQQKIVMASLMAPSGLIKRPQFSLGKILTQNHKLIWELIKRYNMYCFPSMKYSLGKIVLSLCVDSTMTKICSHVLQLAVEIKPTNITQFQYMWPIMFRFVPRASTKQFVHFFQIASTEKFRQFDYGTKRNLEIYGKSEPPEYFVENIAVPIAFYYALKDNLATYKDIQEMCGRILRCEKSSFIHNEDFVHLDFVLSYNLEELVNIPVIRFMEKYDEN